MTKSGKSSMHVVCAPCQNILGCSSDSYPSSTPQSVPQTNSSMCVSASCLEKVCRGGDVGPTGTCLTANRRTDRQCAGGSPKPMFCRVFAVLLRASQCRIFLSDDFSGIVKLLFFGEVCAHQTQSNRRPRSPHDFSQQLDRRDCERYVVIDVCQEFAGPFTPFSDRQLWEPWNTLLRMQ